MWPREGERISFLIARDGVEAAAQWALATARSYRKVVVIGKTHTMYRRSLIESSLELKRFGLATRPGGYASYCRWAAREFPMYADSFASK